MRGLGISQVPSSHVGTTPSIVIWLNTIYYTTDQPFTWRRGKSLVHSPTSPPPLGLDVTLGVDSSPPRKW